MKKRIVTGMALGFMSVGFAAVAADAPATGAELPSRMVPIKPNAAEAYWNS